jgi:hypothetical protein
MLANSISPVSEQGGTWKCSIDKQDIPRDSIRCCCCVHELEIVLSNISICSTLRKGSFTSLVTPVSGTVV